MEFKGVGREVGEAAVGIPLAVELDDLPAVAGERHVRLELLLRGRRRRRRTLGVAHLLLWWGGSGTRPAQRPFILGKYFFL